MNGIEINIRGTENLIGETLDLLKMAIEVTDEVLSGKCLTCEKFDNCSIPKDKEVSTSIKVAAEKAIAAIEEFHTIMGKVMGAEQEGDTE